MDAVEKLGLFVFRADRLLETRLVRQYLPHSMSIQYHHQLGLQIREAFPDEDDLRALLTHVRPFWLKGEPIYLNWVYNTCLRRLTKLKPRWNLHAQSLETPQWRAFRRAGPAGFTVALL